MNTFESIAERTKGESDIRMSLLTIELQKTIAEVDDQLNGALTGPEIALTLLKMVTGYQVRVVEEEVSETESKPDIMEVDLALSNDEIQQNV